MKAQSGQIGLLISMYNAESNGESADRFSSTGILPVICAFTSTAAEFTRPLGVFQTGAAHSNRGRDLSVPRISGSFVCMRHHLLRYTEARLQSNFQIRLRLTFLRISSKRGWLDRCLELEFLDRVALWNFKFAFTLSLPTEFVVFLNNHILFIVSFFFLNIKRDVFNFAPFRGTETFDLLVIWNFYVIE